MTLYFNIDRWKHLSDDEKEDLKILARLFNADDEEQLILLYRVLQREGETNSDKVASQNRVFETAR